MTPDLLDLLNFLLDLEQASQARLAEAARQARGAAIRAHLAARATEHGAAAGQLQALLAAQGGTARRGPAAAGRPRSRPPQRTDRALLADGLAGEALGIEHFSEALQSEDMPAPVRRTLLACKAAAEIRHRSFQALLAQLR